MKRKVLATVLLILSSILCRAQTRSSAAQIFAKIKDSVVVIIAGKHEDKESAVQGSGFVIGKDQVATNFHVVSGMDLAVVAFQDGRTEAVKGAVWYDPDQDLVVLSTQTGKASAIVLGDELSLRQGDHVLALGAPEGLNLSLTDGIVSSFRKMEGTFMIQSTAPISHGSSGGPLLNERGQVVGITTLMMADAPGIYFSIGVSALKQLLKSQSLGLTTLARLPQPESDAQAAPAGEPELRPPAGSATVPSGPAAATPTPRAPSFGKTVDQGPIQDLLNQERYREARVLIDDALGKGIENAVLLRQKASVEWRLGNYPDASRYFEKSIAADPSNTVTRFEYVGFLVDDGQWDRALVQGEALNRLSPGIDTQRFLAKIYYFSHRYPDAKSMAQAVLAAKPDDAQSLKVLAGIAYWSHPLDRSLWQQYLATLKKVDPDAVWVHIAAALGKYATDPAGAFAELDLAARDEFPESAPYLLASAYHVQSYQFKEAYDAIKNGLDMNPHDPAMLSVAVWVGLLNHHELEAGRYIESLKKSSAPNNEELDAAACLYYRINDVPSALSYCREEVALRRSPTALANYGWALLDAGKYQEARRQFEQAESLRDPNQQLRRESLIDAQWAMILAYYYTGDRQAAVSSLKALRAADSAAVDPDQLRKLALVWSDPTLKRIHDVLKALK